MFVVEAGYGAGNQGRSRSPVVRKDAVSGSTGIEGPAGAFTVSDAPSTSSCTWGWVSGFQVVPSKSGSATMRQ